MKKINENSVILRFCDASGVIHDVGLDSILYSGMPIEEDDGSDMEYLGVYMLDSLISAN